MIKIDTFTRIAAYELEVEILNLTDENARRKDIMKTAKLAYNASKKMLSILSELQGMTEEEKEIYDKVQEMYELQDMLKLKIEENETRIEQNKELIKKYERAIKALK